MNQLKSIEFHIKASFQELVKEFRSACPRTPSVRHFSIDTWIVSMMVSSSAVLITLPLKASKRLGKAVVASKSSQNGSNEVEKRSGRSPAPAHFASLRLLHTSQLPTLKSRSVRLRRSEMISSELISEFRNLMKLTNSSFWSLSDFSLIYSSIPLLFFPFLIFFTVLFFSDKP